MELAETCGLYRLRGAHVIKCGTVGERAAQGTEALSTASVSDSGEMPPPVTCREQTSKRQKQINGFVLQVS